MAYVCLECNEIYTEKMGRCPKASCCGEVVEVDELMIPTIIALNEKGYVTDYCCSGHFYDKRSTPYIMFSECMFEAFSEKELVELFKDLPEPWYIDEYDCPPWNFCIRARMLDGMNDVETLEYIADLNIKLIKFVGQLPFIG